MISKKLINAVLRNIDRERLPDVATHGAACGFGNFIYYRDTVRFFKDNRREIVELVKEMAAELGETPIELVSSFNCIRDERGEMEAEISHALYGRIASDEYTIPNALAWFALEEVARELTDR